MLAVVVACTATGVLSRIKNEGDGYGNGEAAHALRMLDKFGNASILVSISRSADYFSEIGILVPTDVDGILRLFCPNLT